MSKQSFIKRILSLGKGEEGAAEGAESESLSASTLAEGGAMEATLGAEAAAKPSITEILFRRRSGEEVAETVTKDEARPVVPDHLADRRLSKREETAQKLSEGFDNLSGMLKSINQKLETGNERGQTLADSIENLPEVLKSIPETNRAQIEFLGTISKQLDLQTVRSGELMEHLRSLPDILKSLPEGQKQQAEELREIANQIRATSEGQADTLMGIQKSQGATLAAFQNAQNKSLNVFHKAQQQSLSAFKGSQATQARQIQDFIERTQSTTNRVLIACACIVSVAVLGVAAMFLLK